MKLSTRCRYGTRAMIDIAQNSGGGPVKRKDIAERQGISEHYLENILMTLKANSLIRAVRGARGGFLLNGSPTDITMFQVVRALEGSFAPVHCLDDPDDCDRTGGCPSRMLWGELHDAFVRILEGRTLADMVKLDALPNCGHKRRAKKAAK